MKEIERCICLSKKFLSIIKRLRSWKKEITLSTSGGKVKIFSLMTFSGLSVYLRKGFRESDQQKLALTLKEHRQTQGERYLLLNKCFIYFQKHIYFHQITLYCTLFTHRHCALN